VAAFIIPAADLLLLTAVVVERRCALAPLPLAVDDRSNVQQAHNRSDNRVRNDRAPLSVSQLQTKPAVDHSENDGDATNADVCKGCGRTASVLLESTVVQPTAERLGEEDDEQHDTDDWVRVGEVSAVHSNPDADAECDDVDEEADDLQSSMNPDKAGEACDSDENSTDGEEGEESESCKLLEPSESLCELLPVGDAPSSHSGSARFSLCRQGASVGQTSRA
jgi:hypothetical protein